MNKNTSAIDTNLYPKVVSSLMKNMGKYNTMISRFMAIRADAMYDTFPSSRIPYGTRDVMDLYDALGLTEQEIMQSISDAYFFQIRDFNPRAAKNAVTCLCCCIIRYFYNKNDKKNIDLAMIYLAFSGNFYPSIHFSSFKVVEPKQYQHVVNYVVNEYMDGKYDIKAKGSLFGAINQTCSKCVETYGERLLKKKVMMDEDYVYFIQQLHTRIKSFMHNCAEAYYECYNKKLYMTYTSDNISEDAEKFRIAESDLSRAELLTQKTMSMLASHDVDYKTAKRSSNDRVKTDEIMDFMSKTIKDKDNIPKLQELIRLKLILYIKDSGKPTIDDTIGFVTYSITPSPNTVDKDKIREKELLTEILLNNADSYRKRSQNAKVEILYRQALNTYIALSIVDAFKK